MVVAMGMGMGMGMVVASAVHAREGERGRDDRVRSPEAMNVWGERGRMDGGWCCSYAGLTRDMTRRYRGALAGLAVGLVRYTWASSEFAPRKDIWTELFRSFLGACFGFTAMNFGFCILGNKSPIGFRELELECRLWDGQRSVLVGYSKSPGQPRALLNAVTREMIGLGGWMEIRVGSGQNTNWARTAELTRWGIRRCHFIVSEQVRGAF
jgi:hypothetical protein